MAPAGRTLHAPAEARRAFRDLDKMEAAKLPECWPGQQDVGYGICCFLIQIAMGTSSGKIQHQVIMIYLINK